jgi:preprotein translocase subunit SecY
MVAVVALTVAVTVAARRIPIQIPRKVMGRGRIREGQKTFIPLRLNTANVMPIVFAQSIIIVPGTIAQFVGGPGLKEFANTYFNTNSPIYLVLLCVLIVFFSYFYTSIIFNPVDLAENLKKQGGFIPGVKPGAPTADYIDEVLSRITLPGALFLSAVALIPIVISNGLHRAADRRRRRARYRPADSAAPHSAPVRRLHAGRRPVAPLAAGPSRVHPPPRRSGLR